MRSQQLIEVLKGVIATDLRKPGGTSVAGYFLNHNTLGGWEAWLQTEYALAVFGAIAAGNHAFDRERGFPDGKRCDLLLMPERGVPIWVELKAQRAAGYGQTFNEFVDDVVKLYSQSDQFRRENVMFAAGIFVMSDALRQPMAEFVQRVRAGTLTYQIFYNNQWLPLADLRKIVNGALVLATFAPV